MFVHDCVHLCTAWTVVVIPEKVFAVKHLSVLPPRIQDSKAPPAIPQHKLRNTLPPIPVRQLAARIKQPAADQLDHLQTHCNPYLEQHVAEWSRELMDHAGQTRRLLLLIRALHCRNFTCRGLLRRRRYRTCAYAGCSLSSTQTALNRSSPHVPPFALRCGRDVMHLVHDAPDTANLVCTIHHQWGL